MIPAYFTLYITSLVVIYAYVNYVNIFPYAYQCLIMCSGGLHIYVRYNSTDDNGVLTMRPMHQPYENKTGQQTIWVI